MLSWCCLDKNKTNPHTGCTLMFILSIWYKKWHHNANKHHNLNYSKNSEHFSYPLQSQGKCSYLPDFPRCKTDVIISIASEQKWFCFLLSDVSDMYRRASLARVVPRAAPIKKSPSIMYWRNGGRASPFFETLRGKETVISFLGSYRNKRQRTGKSHTYTLPKDIHVYGL